MMLLPKKLDPETSEVKACDEELQDWVTKLPEEAKYTDNYTGEKSIYVSRALLHMVFFTTLSALHRPQVLPSAQGGPASLPAKVNTASEVLDVSRRNVRRAASAITSIAQRLDSLDLVKYLPTAGVTVLLPAIIVHLLDIKAPEEETRRASLRGFCQCMTVMGQLRDMYAAADFSMAFLEAAIRKAGIHIAPAPAAGQQPSSTSAAALSNKIPPVTSVDGPVPTGKTLDMQNHSTASRQPPRSTLTPPPDSGTTTLHMLEKSSAQHVTDDEVARRLETFLASTPPDSDHDQESQLPAISIAEDPAPIPDSDPFAAATDSFGYIDHHQDDELLFSSLPMNAEFDDADFESLLNLDAVGETFAFEDVCVDPSMAMGPEVDWLGSGFMGGEVDVKA